MPRIYHPIARYSLLVGLFSIAGCASSPLVKTPVGWYHSAEGGIVAQPRLPVPGNDQQYPYVGLTPTQAPPLPSKDLQNTITASLEQDQSLTEWQNTVDPLDIPKVPPAPQQPVKAAPTSNPQQKNNAPDNESSASFDAVGQDPTPQPATANSDNKDQKQPLPTLAKKAESPKKTEITKPEPVVMPALRTQVDDKMVVIPAIPVSPPPPSKFPGFDVPSDANLPPAFRPANLPLETPRGELIRFPIDSDIPYTNQDKTINSAAWARNDRTIFVHGYGDAGSIAPEDQAKALSLALLRAKTVAKMLIAHNVPESAIQIRAHTIGHGVRIRMDQ